MGIERVMAATEELERRIDFPSLYLCVAMSLLVPTMIFGVIYGLSVNLIDETCDCNGITFPKSRVPVEDERYFYSFCKTSLKAAPGSGRAADPRELGLIAIRLWRDNTTDTSFYIKQLLGKKGLTADPSMKRLLENCLVLYSAGVGKLTDEVIEEEYQAEKFSEVRIHVSTVLTSSMACEDSFREVGLVSPLTKQNNDAKWLSLISLRFLAILQPMS